MAATTTTTLPPAVLTVRTLHPASDVVEVVDSDEDGEVVLTEELDVVPGVDVVVTESAGDAEAADVVLVSAIGKVPGAAATAAGVGPI